MKKILVISALFPPDILGGAEMSAYNLSLWLSKNGYEVGVLTTAKTKDEVCDGVLFNGLRVWRVFMPRSYPIQTFQEVKSYKKPLWHLQDHFDPRNSKIVNRVIDEFKPDRINVHYIQGIGYNALKVIAKRQLPTVFFLHDLGLSCIRMSMFHKGIDCAGQCLLCKCSSVQKIGILKEFKYLGLCSPSQANLDKLGEYIPLPNFKSKAILNANKYPSPTVQRTSSNILRFLYIGRLHTTKGVDLLLKAASQLANNYNFTFTIIGSGPDETELKKNYESASWCTFEGFISQDKISNFIVNSDVLCIPSIWAENSPGVVIHSLWLGLPVIGSRRGGIPELVKDGINGRLVDTSTVDAWSDALKEVILNPELLVTWRNNAIQDSGRFEQDFIGKEVLDFINEISPS
jgi:glycosyltransferase involved in cell wall biosynthesis